MVLSRRRRRETFRRRRARAPGTVLTNGPAPFPNAAAAPRAAGRKTDERRAHGCPSNSSHELPQCRAPPLAVDAALDRINYVFQRGGGGLRTPSTPRSPRRCSPPMMRRLTTTRRRRASLLPPRSGPLWHDATSASDCGACLACQCFHAAKLAACSCARPAVVVENQFSTGDSSCACKNQAFGAGGWNC